MLRIVALSGHHSQLPAARRTTKLLPRSAQFLTTTRRQQSSSSTVVVSRRKWNEYLQKSAPKLKGSETIKASKPDEKPWPRSVRWTGYFLAATLVPYTVVWICLTNESTRPLVLDNCGPYVERILREHFGEKEIDELSYVDLREDGLPVPKKFVGELSHSIREQQQRIEADLQKPLKVRVKLRSPDSEFTTAETEVQAPATEWARKEDLVAKLSAVDKAAVQTSALAVDFPLEKVQDEFDADPQPEATEIDPLREEARVYSLWHYQPAAPPAPAASSSSGIMSNDEIHAAHLRALIARLEEELKNSTVASRPIDDITEELERNRAALRRIQWRKWLPWY
uniref:Uncharacterized protein n=1 Tax=Amphora coffeiformis TaxID=265554 RepID=A0A7S3PDW6_9STRA